MTEETPDVQEVTPEEVAPGLTDQEQQFLAALFQNPQVSSILTTPELKIIAAQIQQKVSVGNKTS